MLENSTDLRFFDNGCVAKKDEVCMMPEGRTQRGKKKKKKKKESGIFRIKITWVLQRGKRGGQKEKIRPRNNLKKKNGFSS